MEFSLPLALEDDFAVTNLELCSHAHKDCTGYQSMAGIDKKLIIQSIKLSEKSRDLMILWRGGLWQWDCHSI